MRNSTRYRDSKGRAANSGITPEIRTTESVEIKEDAILCVTVDVSALDSGPYMSFRGISAISKGWFCTNRTSFDNRRTILTTLAIKRRGGAKRDNQDLVQSGNLIAGEQFYIASRCRTAMGFFAKRPDGDKEADSGPRLFPLCAHIAQNHIK